MTATVSKGSAARPGPNQLVAIGDGSRKSGANGFGWFVVQVHPRKETFAKGRIEELGRDVFLPLKAARGSGTRRTVVGPLFPGYVFARLSERDGDLPRVRWAHGVRRLLGDGERPRAVPDWVVETIRSRTDTRGCLRPMARLKRGERVRIVEGPLAGLVGLLERPATTSEQRVWILVELFRRVTRVDLRLDDIGSVGAA